MSEKKITRVNALTYVIENCSELPDEIRDKLQSMLDTESNKTSGPRKPTERQIENSDIARAIVRYMRANPDKLYSLSELWKDVPGIPEDMTNQRLNYIVRTMLPTYGKDNTGTGELVRVQEKRNVFFKVNPDYDFGEDF